MKAGIPLASLVLELLSPNVWSVCANAGDASRCCRTARIIGSEISRGLQEKVCFTVLLRISIVMAAEGYGLYTRSGS